MINYHEMNSNNLVVVHFNQYTGGKFYINLLSHHEGILPGLGVHDDTGPRHAWMLTGENVEENKIKTINQTIPPRERMYSWSQYELGCKYFWGALFYQIIDRSVKPGNASLDLLKRNLCFICNHEIEFRDFKRCTTTWPKAQHIVLYNGRKFQTRAASFKTLLPRYTYTEPNWIHDPSIQTWLAVKNIRVFKVDVDTTFVSEKRIIESVNTCMIWLGKAYDPHLNFQSYLQKYLRLHQQ